MAEVTNTPDNVEGAPPRGGSSSHNHGSHNHHNHSSSSGHNHNHSSNRRSSQQRSNGSTGFTPSPGTTTTLKRPMPLRHRVDSAGSTRGAFGPIPQSFTSPTKPPTQVSPTKSTPTTSKNVSPETKENHRRKKKRTPKKAAQTPSPEKLIGAEMDLGDMASLAMASMNDDGGGFNRMEKPSSLTTSVPPPRHPPPHPFQQKATPTQAVERHSSIMSDDNDLYFKTLERDTPESADSANALPFFENIKRLGRPSRDDSLRYSGADMEKLLGSMKLNYHDSGDTRFSMSGDTRFSPSPPPPTTSGRKPPHLPAPPETSLNREVSLFGTNLLDDIEAGAAAAEQELNRGYGSVGNQFSSSPYNKNNHSSYQAPPISQQQQEIALFSSMVQGSAGYDAPPAATARVTPETPPFTTIDGGAQIRIEPKRPVTPPEQDRHYSSSFDKSVDTSAYATEDGEDSHADTSLFGRIKAALDPTPWLAADIYYEEDGTAHYEEPSRMIRRLARQLLYTPEVPEFTSLQQFSWAIILGTAMGIYTAIWKNLIEWCVEFTWKTVPEQLYHLGLFTDLNGSFPLPHYMWICPSVFGGILSYIFVILPKPIPGQNEWIKALHSRGVQDHETFWTLFFLSTAGMASGLSLGPELPLVLTAGMIGSSLAVATRQSILSARAMNLTAASAAVAGFFGFPMAGALFVLEIPHRMGLQYFEALSPATIASILAVLVNRMILRNDVTGYYNYPFLTTTLPSHVFYIAIVYGLVGGLVGILYCDVVLKLKKGVHDWFHKAEHSSETEKQEEEKAMNKLASLEVSMDETKPLVQRMESGATQKVENKFKQSLMESVSTTKKWRPSFGIAHEPYRAAFAGTLAGFLTGVTCMFVPHVLFWGEAQLQTLIDKGRTPLPVFGEEGEPTEDLIAYGYCLVDSTDPAAIEAGFSIGCAALISGAKILVVGLSLGTGIIGGHFWGPLFVGCVASHLFTDVMSLVTGWTGILGNLSAYPCVAILCIMGSSHVVTFRAHMAIMLILTLTISAFYPDRDDMGAPTAGDYSAVFPLLVVSCFVSLMVTRDTVFYKEQRSRGDIMAAPEVLCEPGKEGTPFVVDYVDDGEEFYGSDEGSSYYSSSSEEEEDHDQHSRDDSGSLSSSPERSTSDLHITQLDIEAAFEKTKQQDRQEATNYYSAPSDLERSPPTSDREDSDRHMQGSSSSFLLEGGDQLAELLAKPIESQRQKKRQVNRHRRIRSVNDIDPTLPPPSFKTTPGHSRSGSNISLGRRSRSNSVSSRKSQAEERLMRVNSFGELKDFHPSLFDHARQRAASINRPPSLPKSGRHSRQSSQASTSGYSDVMGPASVSGALSHDDVERSFGTAAGRDGRVYGMP